MYYKDEGTFSHILLMVTDEVKLDSEHLEVMIYHHMLGPVALQDESQLHSESNHTLERGHLLTHEIH